MAYLILNDYKTYLQSDYMRQLTQGDDSKRVIEENTSLQAIAQRLVQKYDLNAEFTDLRPYNSSTVYRAAERVVVDISPNGFRQWAASTNYSAGALVINSAIAYVCTTTNNDAVFTPSKWLVFAPQYTIFYGAYPPTCSVNGELNPATFTDPYAPVFNYKTVYTKGDIVFWKGYTYVCNQSSTNISHQGALQYTIYGAVPFGNVFPDDPVQNIAGTYWNAKTAYGIPAGTIYIAPYNSEAAYTAGNNVTNNGITYVCITDTPDPSGAFDPTLWQPVTYWVQGDNRNQTIKDAMVRITVFKLSPLLAPRNRPEVWLDDYRSILRELNEAAEGRITMALPLNQPQNGLRTYGGGEVKRQNNY